ncbi:TusE/DsrC/DsvC family sulfur relay protein [Magnetovibrio sp.]|uniref:TusE/DsrC/DsvC family sulfur relay protein n=1 Tax=Magnetovibrio sp. TaxID=2024836 RepID=UPI002F94D62A
MSTLTAPTGDEGYLLDPADWTEEIAEQLAAAEDLVLTDEHWSVIRYVRDWHAEHGVAPSGRDVIQFMKSQGASRNRLFELFPYGYVQQTCKIAGMIKPRSWSTG